MNKLVFSFFFTITLTACSSKSLYEIGQSYQKNQCVKQAQSAEQHTNCTRVKSQTYEEYEKDRQSVINK